MPTSQSASSRPPHRTAFVLAGFFRRMSKAFRRGPPGRWVPNALRNSTAFARSSACISLKEPDDKIQKQRFTHPSMLVTHLGAVIVM